MNKVISFAFLAIFVFYGFNRCSKLHPAKYFSKQAKPAPADAPPDDQSVEPAEVNNPFLDPANAEIRKRLQAKNEAARESPTIREPESEPDPAQPVAALNESDAPGQPEGADGFTCQGKIHCSQMISCDEAKFYLWNCPDTKMDGDNDGNPCESMCGY